MRLIHILFLILGWIGLKYFLLGNASFETSFLAGIIYNYTAMIVIAVLCVITGIRTLNQTPDFIDAFKMIAKKVLVYSVVATMAIAFWHHYLIQDITTKRLEERIYEKKNAFGSEEEYAVFVEENPALNGLSLEEWVAKETESIELIFSLGIQTSLTMMAYLVIGLFISLIASFLWTKVWFTQQSKNESV
ncbi:MAG: hypothetical protein CMB32_03320 [Euryarchaeota archaeon]|nr:hypothetical protein [Euryarchaeota archaeon]|tara:strand:- start:1607 stop:2176 length:570 start_codon:yes stop_codon:yes gene_type:complete